MLEQWPLLVLYAVLGIANIARGILAWVAVSALTTRQLSLPLPLVGAIYVVWGLALPAAGLAYSRRPGRRTRILARAAAIMYQATVWTVRFLGDRASYSQQLWARDAVLSLLFIVLVLVLTGFPDHRQPSYRQR